MRHQHLHHNVVRVSLFSSVIAVGVIAGVCPAGQDATLATTSATPATTGPAQAVMDVAHGLSEGRPYVAWDALPASYQRDLTELVHAYAAKVDPELWNEGFAIIRKVGSMLQNQKDVILAMPNIQAAEGFDAEKASQQWDLVVAPVLTITNSELANVQSLETMDVRNFLATTGVQFMKDIVRLSEFTDNEATNELAALGQAKATVVSQEGSTAVVKLELPGKPAQTETMVLVEGKWIPEDLATNWTAEMAEGRAQIAKMSSENVQHVKPHLMTMLAGVSGTIDKLDQAESPQQFEQAFQMGVFQVFGGMMELAQAMEPEADRP